ncbi:uncharacterized protein LOC143024580 [Oratosquilla oratoria]|uniref:uncharacterized protein LOC143024580 n=1 Tax=Oratosquilla oratoria TaxID=337810 RepID=UPI003F76DBDA
MVPHCDPIFSRDEGTRLTSISISKEEVVKQIDRLKNTNAPGLDKKDTRVLKECKFEICTQLTEVFSKSVDTGFVVISWGMANDVYIFEKGDNSSMHDYRPIYGFT